MGGGNFTYGTTGTMRRGDILIEITAPESPPDGVERGPCCGDIPDEELEKMDVDRDA